MMEQYNKTLEYFNVEYIDGLPCTKSFVEMDDIHDSFLYHNFCDIEYWRYVTTSKHRAYNRKRHIAYIVNYRNENSIKEQSIENYNFLDDYLFTEQEKDICIEKMERTPAYKSKYSRRQYEKILNSIKSKLLCHYVSSTVIAGKFTQFRNQLTVSGDKISFNP